MIVSELLSSLNDIKTYDSRLPLNYETFQRLLKSMDTEYDRSVLQSVMASFCTRDDLYHLGIKPDRIVGKLPLVIEASVEAENALVAADGLITCRLKDKLNKIEAKKEEIRKKLQSKELSEKTRSDFKAELELCDVRQGETNGLLNKETKCDSYKYKKAVKRAAIKLLDEHRVKRRKLSTGRPTAMDESDEDFLAKCIAEKSTAHGRRHDVVMYLNHRVKKRHFLSLVNYNLLQRGKKLIRSATTVYNRSRPKNVRSLAAKQHRGKWLFCSKKPPKTEDSSVETTHHQRAHVKNAKLEVTQESRDGSLICSMDDKAYLRPGTRPRPTIIATCDEILYGSIYKKHICICCSFISLLKTLHVYFL